MARIEWVKQRLENWALWKEREATGGLGYARQSVLLTERVDRYREADIPVDNVEAEVTNQAVESLRVSRPLLYQTLQLIYISDLGVKGTARRTGRADSTIHAHLDQADQALAAWFSDRAAAQRARKPAPASS